MNNDDKEFAQKYLKVFRKNLEEHLNDSFKTEETLHRYFKLKDEECPIYQSIIVIAPMIPSKDIRIFLEIYGKYKYAEDSPKMIARKLEACATTYHLSTIYTKFELDLINEETFVNQVNGLGKLVLESTDPENIHTNYLSTNESPEPTSDMEH